LNRCGSHDKRFENLEAPQRPATLLVAISVVVGGFDRPGSKRPRDFEVAVVARALEKNERTSTSGIPLGER